jgi:hypothetical protein
MNIKKEFFEIISVENAGEYLLKWNRIMTNVILTVSAVSFVFLFIKSLFSGNAISIFFNLFGPVYFILIKCSLATFRMIIDWMNASTTYYRSQLNK